MGVFVCNINRSPLYTRKIASQSAAHVPFSMQTPFLHHLHFLNPLLGLHFLRSLSRKIRIIVTQCDPVITGTNDVKFHDSTVLHLSIQGIYILALKKAVFENGRYEAENG